MINKRWYVVVFGENAKQKVIADVINNVFKSLKSALNHELMTQKNHF
ncbi:hypothetical protein [Companilactobacillus paralimentarius]